MLEPYCTMQRGLYLNQKNWLSSQDPRIIVTIQLSTQYGAKSNQVSCNSLPMVKELWFSICYHGEGTGKSGAERKGEEWEQKLFSDSSCFSLVSLKVKNHWAWIILLKSWKIKRTHEANKKTSEEKRRSYKCLFVLQ